MKPLFFILGLYSLISLFCAHDYMIVHCKILDIHISELLKNTHIFILFSNIIIYMLFLLPLKNIARNFILWCLSFSLLASVIIPIIVINFNFN